MLASTSRVKAGNDLFRTLGDNGELSCYTDACVATCARISVGLLINAAHSRREWKWRRRDTSRPPTAAETQPTPHFQYCTLF